MKYVITVHRIDEGERKSKEWHQVQSTELARERNEREYAYTESVERYREPVKIFEQTVEVIDDAATQVVRAVVKAVNFL